MSTQASLNHEGMQQQWQNSESETGMKGTKMKCDVVYLTLFVKEGESDVERVLQM